MILVNIFFIYLSIGSYAPADTMGGICFRGFLAPKFAVEP
jgi:hypothetical protein